MAQNVTKEGSLHKQSRHMRLLRKRWTVLQEIGDGNYLCTYKKEKIYEAPTEVIPIDNATDIGVYIDVYDEDNLMFFVKNKKNGPKFLFEAESTHDRDQWIQCIENIKNSQNS